MGVTDTLDRLAEKGEPPPFIVAMPRDWMWNEPTVDNFGQAVVKSLVPWMDEHYHTLPEREYRAIGGLSLGGSWALHIRFSLPELFSAVGTHSGIVVSKDVVDFYQRVNNFPEVMMPRVYIDVGDKDRQENIMYALGWIACSPRTAFPMNTIYIRVRMKITIGRHT
jgi:poly(3-hydroxybutyrate) depolymerase